MFNLPAPVGFRGLDPDLPIQIYNRHLPHWRQDGATYFVTFRLADSIPQEHLHALKRWRIIWEQQHPEPRSEQQWKEFAQEITSKTERWLDEGCGDCVLGGSFATQLMSKALLKFQDTRYLTSSFVVMPNHVHLLMKPLPGYKLETLLQGIKAKVSKEINQRHGRSGSIWEEESHDRIVRDDEHLWQCLQYIGSNPSKASLPTGRYLLWLHPEWEAAGWRYQ